MRKIGEDVLYITRDGKMLTKIIGVLKRTETEPEPEYIIEEVVGC